MFDGGEEVHGSRVSGGAARIEGGSEVEDLCLRRVARRCAVPEGYITRMVTRYIFIFSVYLFLPLFALKLNILH